MDTRCQERISKILDALYDVAYRYSDTNVTVYPIFDVLQLLLQKPTIWTLFEVKPDEACRHVFTTFRDPEWESRFWNVLDQLNTLRDLEANTSCYELPATSATAERHGDRPPRYYLCVHLMKPRGDGDMIEPSFWKLDPPDADLVRQLLSALEQEMDSHVSKTARHVMELMRNARQAEAKIAPLAPRERDYEPEQIREQDGSDSGRFRNIVRKIIDDSFREIESSRLLRSDASTISNAFFVVRRAIEGWHRRGFFPYTAQIVLSSSQAANQPNDEVVQSAQGKTCRSIADSAFGSGVADFAMEKFGSGGRDVGGDWIDTARRRAEEQFFKGLGEHIFYVPLHVGGVAWAGLLTFSHSDRRGESESLVHYEIWEHNYYFYRTITPQLAERFRVNARRTYFELLYRDFTEEMANATDLREQKLIQNINVRWRLLTKYFPFGLVVLNADRSDKAVLRRQIVLPKGTAVQLNIETNPHRAFQMSVEFDVLVEKDLEDLVENLQRASEHIGEQLLKQSIGKLAAKEASNDLADQLVQALGYVQDWQSIICYQKLSTGLEPVFSYSRTDTGDWKRDATAASIRKERIFDSWGFHEFCAKHPDVVTTPEDLADLPAVGLIFDAGYEVGSGSDDARDAVRRKQKLDQAEILKFVIPRVRAHRYSTQTAAAAIMSRNLSHNIGSNPISREISRLTIGGAGFSTEVVKKERREAAHLLTYLRDRMDYLAEITTGQPTWGATADLRDVCAAFGHQKVLLRGLTSIEHCRVDAPETQSPPIFLPHGSLGAQALYTIFENMIRNSVQYRGTDAQSRPGRLSLQFESVDDCVVLTIVDLGQPRPNDEAEASSVIDGLKARFTQSFHIGEGRLSQENWGLKEMKISAAFLRLRPGWIVDEPEDGTGTLGWDGTKGRPWLEPTWCSYRAREYLCHKIIMLKPKFALIVGATLSADARAALDSVGLETIDRVDALFNFARTRSIPHQFVLVPGAQIASLTEARNIHTKSNLPIRVLRFSEGGDSVASGESDIDLGELVSLSTGASAVGNVHARLARAWNDVLVRRAMGEKQPRLVLAVADTRSDADVGQRVLVERANVLSRNLERSGRPLIICDRHANDHGSLYSDQRECCWQHEPCRAHPDRWHDVQAYIGFDRGRNPIGYGDAAGNDPVEVERLIEAGLVWVLVIDERVAVSLRSHPVERCRLARAGIAVMPFKDETEITPAELDSENICRFLQDMAALLAGPPGLIFATAHLALLKSHHIATNAWFRGIELGIRQQFPSVAVEVATHSGRGKPPELRQLTGVRFLEYANLDAHIHKPADKIKLVDMLLALRRTEGEDGQEMPDRHLE